MTENYRKSNLEIILSNLKWPTIFAMFIILLISYCGDIRDLLRRMKQIGDKGAAFYPPEVKWYAEDIPADTAFLPNKISPETENFLRNYGNLQDKNLGLDVYKVAAFSYLKQGRFEKTISELKKVLTTTTTRDDSSWAFYNWGVALSQLNKHNEAIVKYQMAMKLKPNSAEVYVSWGLSLAALKKYELAAEKFKKAVEINPKFDEAYYNLAKVQASLGQKNEAIINLKKAIDLDKMWKQEAKTDPDFDNIRNDPEFKKLVEE